MRLLTLFLLISSPLFAALPKPAKVEASSEGPTPVFHWADTEGASVYRVAVFAAPDAEGKRPLMAAVWVKGLSWAYGSSKVLAKAGKLPSTTPKPLEPGLEYKVMVSAADENGMNKSDWAAASFTAGLAAKAPARSPLSLSATASPSTTPTPTEIPAGTATPTPQINAKGGTGPAELEVDLASEFKESPETGEAGLAPAAALPSTLEGARQLLQKGNAEDAEAAYKALLDKDATSADAWEGLGDSFDARKMKVEAKEAYEKALALDKKRTRLAKWMDDNVKR
jgi:hypothetical protein